MNRTASNSKVNSQLQNLRYQQNKRDAASGPGPLQPDTNTGQVQAAPEQLKQAAKAIEAANQLLDTKKWHGQQLYLKQKKQQEPADEGLESGKKPVQQTVPSLSVHTSLWKELTGDAVKQSNDARQYFENLATVLQHHPNTKVQAAADRLVEVVTAKKALYRDDLNRPCPTATYYGGVSDVKILRGALKALDTELKRANAAGGTRVNQDSTQKPANQRSAVPGTYLKPAPSEPKNPPTSVKPASPQPQPPQAVNPSEPWPGYKRPALCFAPSPGSGQASDFRQLAAAAQKHLREEASANGVVYMQKGRNGHWYVGVRPKDAVLSPRSTQLLRDSFAEFLSMTADAAGKDSHRGIRAYADKLRALAPLARKTDLPANHPAIQEIFGVLAQLDAPPQAQDAHASAKPVLQATSAPKLAPQAPAWVTVGSYNSDTPPKLVPKSAALTMLYNALRQIPTSYVIEVGQDSQTGEMRVRARPPVSGQEPSDSETDAATRQFLLDLGDYYMKEYFKRDIKIASYGANLQQIALSSGRYAKAITNSPALHATLLGLARAG